MGDASVGASLSPCVFIFCLSIYAVGCLQVMDFRLEGGATWNEGRVMQHVDGDWLGVCSDGFNNLTATVVCNHLGFPSGRAVLSLRPAVNVTEVPSNVSFSCTGGERSMSDCTATPTPACSPDLDVFVTCPRNVRLNGGNASSEGRVEVYTAAAWHPACGSYFTQEDAIVVCKQLGFLWSAVVDTTSNWYGNGGLSNGYGFSCHGNESSLLDCPTSTGCHGAAGVICKTGHVETNQARLVNGTTAEEGRLQILRQGVWATVCGTVWSDANSDVVCHSLFGSTYSGALVPKTDHAPLYGKQHSGAILNSMTCSGGESSILTCSGGSTFSTSSACTHDWDVAIKCTVEDKELGVRLVNQSVDGSGLVQVESQGHWAAACAQDWDVSDATVLCRQLGYPPNATKTELKSSVFSERLARSFLCVGNETSMRECPSSVTQQCTDTKDVFVACQANIRLTGGPVPHIGRLELYSEGSWYKVCRHYIYQFSSSSASVACKQLGFRSSGFVIHSTTAYNQTTLPRYGYRFECTGRESSLVDCVKVFDSSLSSCSDYTALSCVPESPPTHAPPFTRLVGGKTGHEGRLQTFYNGVWTTVCQTSWTSRNSDVVCRSTFGDLYTGVLVVEPERTWLYGSPQHGLQLLDSVSCNENSRNLSECSHSGYVSGCSDVALRCSQRKVRLVNGSVDGTGELQVHQNGRWTPVCANQWTPQDATVVCGEMGYPTNGSYFNSSSAPPREVSDPSFDCRGNELSLSDCPNTAQACNGAHVILHCPARVRLSGGQQRNMGILEIYRNGTWLKQSNSNDRYLLALVCRALGFSSSGGFYYPYYSQSARFPRNSFNQFHYSCKGDDVYLSQCGETYYGYSSSVLGISCETEESPSMPVRLVNGTGPHDGILQVFRSGTWSTVCDRYWTQPALDVACQTMFGQSYKGTLVLPTRRSKLYDEHCSDPILLSDIQCRGEEKSLLECTLGTSYLTACSHANDIALMCNASSVRLVNGSAPGSGAVQFFSGGRWAHVCDHGWGPEDALTVCRELGFPTSGVTDISRQYETDEPVSTLNRSFHCAGDEMSLSHCRSTVLDACPSTGYVAVHCTAKVRLSGGQDVNEGRVEMYDRDGSWYRLYDYSASAAETSLICQQLGYLATVVDWNKLPGVAVRVESLKGFKTGSLRVPISAFGVGRGVVFPYIPYGSCTARETPDVRDCRWYRYPYNTDIAVTCDTGETVDEPIRLQGGGGRLEGVLHVFSHGVWGTVCGSGWTDLNSHVACRQLFGSGFTGSRVALERITSQRGVILLDRVSCNGGQQKHLLDCPLTLAPTNCDHTQDVALKCIARGNECGAILTADSGNFSSPGFPAAYTAAEDCVWIIDSSKTGDVIHLSLSHLNISETQCATNHLQVVDTDSGTVLASYCGAGIPEPLTSKGSALMVRLVSTFNAFGNSFQASWNTECRRHLTAETGVVQSPGFPGAFPRDKDCSFLIERPPGEVITLTFDRFNLGSDCGKNYVEVRDGPSAGAPLLGERLCGDRTGQTPLTLRSSQYSLWVKFHTEGGSSTPAAGATGFRATYTSSSPGCSSADLNNSSGSITSPGFPYPYPNNTRCQWTVTAPKGSRVKLTFRSVRTYGLGSECFGQSVSIYDFGDDEKAKLVDTLCGRLAGRDMEPVESTGNRLRVVFQSQLYLPFYWTRYQLNGFQADYVVYDPEDERHTLFSFGATGQRTVLNLRTDETIQLPYLEAGIPVGHSRQHKVFVSSNGFLTFGSDFIPPDLVEYKMMVCAYASYIDLGSTGNISYSLFTEGDFGMMSKASEEVQKFLKTESFTATSVLVVTWSRVRQRTASGLKDGEATFEAVVITDGAQTFALIQHLVGGMHWQPDDQWPKVTIGVADGSGTVQESLYSGNPFAYTIDTRVGNTGRRGSWLYKLGEVEAGPEEECRAWYARNLHAGAGPDDRTAAVFSALPRCPCSRRDVWRRARVTWTLYRSDDEGKVHCYRLTKTASQEFYPYSKECCYGSDGANRETFDQLIIDAPYAGSALAFNPAYWALRAGHERDDRQGHSACCLRASDKFCKLFYQLRPVGECQADIPFTFSWMFGDPHISTLDGRQYTFNGWGEYTMVSIATENVTFTLQGRTGLAETEAGVLTNATVFTAFGAQENGVRVFVELDPSTRDSLVIYAGETDYSVAFGEDELFEVEEDAFTLRRDNTSLVVAFASAISMTVTAGRKSLDISVAMPLNFRNRTRGLLGNYNGDPTDDFRLPDGTALSGNLTERQIFEDFGKKWAVGQQSVMRYGPRESFKDYAHPEFQPLYLDEQSPATRQEGEHVCGGTENVACLYDYAATRSSDFAQMSGQTKDTADLQKKQSANRIPRVRVPANISVEAGQRVTIAAQGEDDDLDALTFKLTDDAVAAGCNIDNKTGNITATFSASNPASLGVYAVDVHGAQSPVMAISVWVCTGCSGHGRCDYARARHDLDNDSGGQGSSNSVQVAACLCQPAYTGWDCEAELDACLDRPCLANQTCHDLTAAEQGSGTLGFSCTGCPDGFRPQSASASGSNSISRSSTPPAPGFDVCVDVDECAEGSNSLNHCQHVCNNTDGSYVCSCRAGFRLRNDGLTCADVNECREQTSGCNQTCSNTQGSFGCGCRAGYSLAADGRDCVINMTSSSSAACATAACAQGCQPVRDSSGLTHQCFCFSGYELHKDGVSCQDIDECQLGLCDGDCLNSEGSFACSCHKGYALAADRRTCTPCSALTYGAGCRLTCLCNGRGKRCDHVNGCVCQDGWTGRSCETDVDECAENPDVCGGEGKGERRVCSNLAGSYACLCRAGFSLNASGVCVDTDECAEGSALNECGERELCRNVPGTYYCTCNAGYHRVNTSCIDMDECSHNGGGCPQKCVNVPGSYNCECNYGYRLHSDRATCVQDVAVKGVCAAQTELHCNQGCSVSENGTAFCFCETGYSLGSDSQTCNDVDECSSGVANCSDTCHNTAGGFHCSCPQGTRLDNDQQTCLACPAGTWGDSCAKTCSCASGSERCDVTRGCVCQSGWTGARCDRDVNECDNLTAVEGCTRVGADCVNYRGGFHCLCTHGLTTDAQGNCTDIDECLESPCSQKCENTDGSYACLCNAGFTLDSDGRTCNDVDECTVLADNHCSQRCDNTAGSFRCSCHRRGFTLSEDGITCVESEACDHTTCDPSHGGCDKAENGTETCFCNTGYSLGHDNATCSFIERDWCGVEHSCQQQCTETDFHRSFQCSCFHGYLLNSDKRTCRACPEGQYGEGCKQECACTAQHTATCNSTTGECVCHPGWTGDQCLADVNECQRSRACPDHSLCANTEGSFLCNCLEGFSKEKGVCQDVDECEEGTDNCKQGCVNVPGSFRCDCEAGYTLQADNYTCSDVDECEEGTDNCKQGCVNVPGSFRCDCEAGYTLQADNYTCSDVDECEEGTDSCEQRCVNVPGSFRCDCEAGYTLQTDNYTCSDVDECEEGTDNCKQGCVNVPGSFRCDCEAGYTLQTDNYTCSDVDECEEGTDNCKQGCVNVPGSFRCDCEAGYTLQADNYTCSDVDECEEGTDNCKQGCVNVPGSFRCDCEAGDTLQADNYTCSDVDECEEGTDSCEQRCVNVPGSFRCDCEAGYTLQADNYTCSDVDECEEGTDNCKQGCVNVPGSFRCDCEAGYTLQADNYTCSDVDECEEGTDNCKQGCVNVPGSFRCDCEAGYTLQADNYTCSDDDECSRSNGGCAHICTNTPGSFVCSCPDGFALNTDALTCSDNDECSRSNGGCSHDCTNTPGSFVCSCPDGFALNTDALTCSESTGLRFELTVNVNVEFDEHDKTSASYMSVERQIKETLTPSFSQIDGFLGVTVLSLRKGSVISQAEAAFAKDDAPAAASNVTSALLFLIQSDVTINGQTARSSVKIGDSQLTGDTRPCDAMIGLGACVEATQTCEETVQGPVCKKALETKSDIWKVVVGVCAGVPALAILVGVVACCVLHAKGHPKVKSMDGSVLPSKGQGGQVGRAAPNGATREVNQSAVLSHSFVQGPAPRDPVYYNDAHDDEGYAVLPCSGPAPRDPVFYNNAYDNEGYAAPARLFTSRPAFSVNKHQ